MNAPTCSPSHHDHLRASGLSGARNVRRVVNLGEPMILGECDRCPSSRPSTLAIPVQSAALLAHLDLSRMARFFGFSVDADYLAIYISETTVTNDELAVRGYFRRSSLPGGRRVTEHKRLIRKGHPVALDACNGWSVHKTRNWIARRDRKILALGGVR